MKKNKYNEKGNPHGYWEDSIGDSLYCGFYEDGERIGVCRTYEDGVLYNIHTRGNGYWDIYNYDHMTKYFIEFHDVYEHIHYHHNE